MRIYCYRCKSKQLPHAECEKECEIWLPFGIGIKTCLQMPIFETWEMVKKYDMREKYIFNIDQEGVEG